MIRKKIFGTTPKISSFAVDNFLAQSGWPYEVGSETNKTTRP